jgi:hypothetical protein
MSNAQLLIAAPTFLIRGFLQKRENDREQQVALVTEYSVEQVRGYLLKSVRYVF